MKRPTSTLNLSKTAFGLLLLAGAAACTAPTTKTMLEPPAPRAPVVHSLADDMPAPEPSAQDATYTLEVGTASPQGIPPPPPGPKHQHFMLLLGERKLDDTSVWQDLDSQFNFGFTFDKQIGDAGVAMDFGMQWSYDSSSKFVGPTTRNTEAAILEFDVGILKMFYPDVPIRPYIGGGIALAWASARVLQGSQFRDDTDFTPGLYGRAGVAYQNGSGPLVGIDFHYLGATDINLDGLGTDIDGWVVSLVLGFGF